MPSPVFDVKARSHTFCFTPASTTETRNGSRHHCANQGIDGTLDNAHIEKNQHDMTNVHNIFHDPMAYPLLRWLSATPPRFMTSISRLFIYAKSPISG
jgi:hypothetical protein